MTNRIHWFVDPYGQKRGTLVVEGPPPPPERTAKQQAIYDAMVPTWLAVQALMQAKVYTPPARV